MGCDIHAHVEVQIDGRWEHYSILEIPRNYRLFTKLAGVRDCEGITPISEPRGIPADITKLTAFDLEGWSGDAHSRSWITGEEADAVEKWMDETQKPHPHPSQPWGYLFGNGFGHSTCRDTRLDSRLGECRIVFWFDN